MKTSWKVFSLLLLCTLPLAACDAFTESDTGPLAASGVVEAVEVLVAAEFSGRITEVLVKESDAVEKQASPRPGWSLSARSRRSRHYAKMPL